MPIHPAAHVDPGAEVDATCTVGPGAIIEAGARVGRGTWVGPNAHIATNTTIGEDCEIHHGTTVGHSPQDLAYDGTPTWTHVGDRTILREFVTVHRASRPGGETRVGSDCMFMVGSHIAHDCIVGNGVITTNGTTLGGHVEVEDGAFLSASVMVHQFVRIGRLVMLGGLSIAVKDIPPFSLAGGRRAVVSGLNVVGLRRAGIDAETRKIIQDDHRTLYRSKLNTSEALEQLRTGTADVTRELADFVEKSKRGLTSFGFPDREIADENIEPR